ncbi:MAG: hypothetical protein E7517_02125 [Ruminococcaceae bacterium]|nr:hypothetical protein [Oscillospiraceae bacterium]
MSSTNTPQSQNFVPAENRENIIKKYGFLKAKIILNYQKGCKILRIAKIAVAVLFVLFTPIAAIIGQRTGQHMTWLTIWLALIFINIAVFIPADYAKYLVQAKVIPYLENDEQVEFGEYDIFAEDIDGNEEDEDDEEEEE